MDLFADNNSRRLVHGLLFTFLLFSWSSAQMLGELNSPNKVEAYLKKQMSESSQDVAMAIYTVNADGSLSTIDAFTYNENKPMPLASTVKVVILAAYAQAVMEGTSDPDEEVSVKDWEAYYLPFTDGGAHPSALESLGIESDELGFAQGDVTVTLDDIVSAMIVQSDNAGTDYLMARLGDEAVARVIEENSLTQELPLSILGMFLAWQNAESPALTRYSPDDFRAATERYKTRYLSDSAWREAQLGWLQTLPDPGSHSEQLEAYQNFTSGSAQTYARIVAGVVTETFVSPEASQVMRKHLEWPMQFSSNRERFETFGTKGGSLPGVLTEAMYLIPKTGDFAGEPRVAVLFFNHLSEVQFSGLFESFAHQEVLLDLMTSRRASEKIRPSE